MTAAGRVIWTPSPTPRKLGYDLRQISNLVLWLDANDMLKSQKTATAISSWTDKSSALAHAVQATGANQPTLVQNIRNGKAVVRFDGTNDWLNFPITMTLGGATVVMVARHRQGASFGWMLGSTGTPNGFHIKANNAATVYTVGASAGVIGAATTGFHVYTMRHSGTAITTFVDGTSAGTATDSGTGAVDLCLGSFNDGQAATFCSMDLAAIAIFAKGLSEAERLYVEAAMTAGYMNLYLPDEIEQDQPVVWIKLDDTVPGGAAGDSGSNASNGTYAGTPNRAVGITSFLSSFGTRFSAPTTQRVTVPDSAAHNTPPFTLEITGMMEQLPDDIGHVFPGMLKGDGTTNSFSFSQGNGNKPFFTVFQSGTPNKLSVTATAACIVGERFHILGTYTEPLGIDDGEVKFYREGVLQGTATAVGGQGHIVDSGAVLSIGGLPGVPEQFYGILQHAAIYSSALSSTRITAHAAAR